MHITPENIVYRLAEQQPWDYANMACLFCDADFHGIDDADQVEHDDECPYAAALIWVSAHPLPPPVHVYTYDDEHGCQYFLTDRQRKIAKDHWTSHDAIGDLMEMRCDAVSRCDPPGLIETPSLFAPPIKTREELIERAAHFEEW